MNINDKKLTYQFIMAAVVTIVGLGLLIAGFIAPPLAEISNSVLIAWGEVSTFAGALIGIDYTYKYKVFINGHKNDEEE